MKRGQIAFVTVALAVLLASFAGKYWGNAVVHPGEGNTPSQQ